MQQGDRRYHGLVADLIPNIRLMQASGHFLFRYITGPVLFRKIYSSMNLILILLQFFTILINLALNTSNVNELTANTITALFFVHSITKFIYFAVSSESFYRTFSVWNQSNSHPLFAESDARYHSISLRKMRRLLTLVMITTLFSVVGKLVLVLTNLFKHVKIHLPCSLDDHHVLRRKYQRNIRQGDKWNAHRGNTAIDDQILVSVEFHERHRVLYCPGVPILLSAFLIVSE